MSFFHCKTIIKVTMWCKWVTLFAMVYFQLIHWHAWWNDDPTIIFYVSIMICESLSTWCWGDSYHQSQFFKYFHNQSFYIILSLMFWNIGDWNQLIHLLFSTNFMENMLEWYFNVNYPCDNFVVHEWEIEYLSSKNKLLEIICLVYLYSSQNFLSHGPWGWVIGYTCLDPKALEF